MGNAFLDQDKLEEAEEAFEKSISFKADYVDARNNLGNALRRQDKSEEAIKAFNKAILLKPTSLKFTIISYNISGSGGN